MGKRKQSNQDELAAFRQARKDNRRAADNAKVQFDVKEKKRAPQLSNLLKVKRKHDDGTEEASSELTDDKRLRVDTPDSAGDAGNVGDAGHSASTATPAQRSKGTGILGLGYASSDEEAG